MSAASEIVLGVDLGTSYSTAAAVIGGKLHFALDPRGEACIPSVVHFPRSGPAIVGAEADRLRASDPHNTVFGVKRIVGRSADSGPARLLDAASAFKIKGQPGSEACVEVRTGQFTATEVAALILRHLRERAEVRFGRRIAKVVCTVPVAATGAVRDAMVRAGKMAGLEVLRIVPEPCAGAVARGFADRSWAEGAPLLVYDFGGGTLDATVVQRDGKAITVLSAGGDDCLGGDDFDLAFARWVASGVYRTRSVDITRDAVLWDRVQRQCELVKRALSGAGEVRYLVQDAFGAKGALDVLVRREHLAPSWAELVQRSVAVAAETLRGADGAPEQLGALLLIGGTSYVPQVRAAVAAAFGRPCVLEDEPQTAVARGAALLAAMPNLLAE